MENSRFRILPRKKHPSSANDDELMSKGGERERERVGDREETKGGARRREKSL